MQSLLLKCHSFLGLSVLVSDLSNTSSMALASKDSLLVAGLGIFHLTGGSPVVERIPLDRLCLGLHLCFLLSFPILGWEGNGLLRAGAIYCMPMPQFLL